MIYNNNSNECKQSNNEIANIIRETNEIVKTTSFSYYGGCMLSNMLPNSATR